MYVIYCYILLIFSWLYPYLGTFQIILLLRFIFVSKISCFMAVLLIAAHPVQQKMQQNKSKERSNNSRSSDLVFAALSIYTKKLIVIHLWS